LQDLCLGGYRDHGWDLVGLVGRAVLFHLVGLDDVVMPIRRDADGGSTVLNSMTKVYASEQKEDHAAYKSIYEANAEEFAMIERNSQYVFLSLTIVSMSFG